MKANHEKLEQLISATFASAGCAGLTLEVVLDSGALAVVETTWAQICATAESCGVERELIETVEVAA